MNIKFMTKEIEFFYEKVKYQLFSVTSSYEAHWQGDIYLDDDTEAPNTF